MSLRLHRSDPTEAVEAAFFRIGQERMSGLPILNQLLSVQAIDFQRWQGHWLGMIVTPWCMSLLLLPGNAENWTPAAQNRRRFVKFPAGDFAFLGSTEPELGEFQSCSIFSPMNRFRDQSEANMTARASLLGLLAPAPSSAARADERKTAGEQPSVSRRRFFAMR